MTHPAGFYVYEHATPDTGVVFYVGKGSGKRAWSRSSRNPHWRFKTAKHGFEVRIIAANLTEIEALALEMSLIHSAGPGVLVNITAGGGGISGYRHTEAARQAMALKRLGSTHTAEARQRMSDTIRASAELQALRRLQFSGEKNPAKADHNRAMSAERMRQANPMQSAEIRAKVSASCKGRAISPETRAKISAATKGRTRSPMPGHVRAALQQVRDARKRAVATLCGLKFDSTLAAAKALGVRQGNIVNNCVGRAKSAGGYVWRYV